MIHLYATDDFLKSLYDINQNSKYFDYDMVVEDDNICEDYFANIFNNSLSVAFLVPHWAFFLNFKKQYLKGVNIENWQFFTPKTLRDHFQSQLNLDFNYQILKENEKLAYLYECLPFFNQSEQLFIKRSSDFICKKIDESCVLGFINPHYTPLLKKIIQCYQGLLEKAQKLHPIIFDRYILKKIHGLPVKIFNQLIIGGFDGRHNALWPFFQTAVTLSKSCDWYLPADSIDAFFKETIESYYQKEAVFLNLNIDEPPVTFIETVSDVDSLHAFEFFLKQCSDHEPCVVTTDSSILRQEILNLLEKNNIQHYDTEGVIEQLKGNKLLLKCWIVYQQERTILAALKFLRQLEVEGFLSGKTALKIEKDWEVNVTCLQSHDLNVLMAYGFKKAESNIFFETWPLWPLSAKGSYYYQKVLNVLESMKIVKEWPLDPFIAEQSLPIEAFLTHLWSFLWQPQTIRHPLGAYSNSGLWVAPLEVAYALKKTIGIFIGSQNSELSENDVFCDGIKVGHEAFIQSSQDASALILKPDHAWVPDAQYFFQKKSHLTALFLNDLSSKNRVIGPSHLKSYLLLKNRLQPCEYQTGLKPLLEPVESFDLSKFKQIHERRLDAHQPFDIYDYGLSENTSASIALSARTWEEALKDPVTVWHTHVLNINDLWDPLKNNGLKKQQGLFVHDWLEYEAFGPTPNGESWLRCVQKKSQKTIDCIINAFIKADKRMSLMQKLFLKEAQSKAMAFVNYINQQSLLPFLYQEYALPYPLYLLGEFSNPLAIKGRIDALFTGDALINGEPSKAAFVLDFKINDQMPLTLDNVKTGYGLQLILYGLSLRAMGFENITCALLSLKMLKKPVFKGMKIDDLEGMDAVWQTINNMSFKGLWGERPLNAYGMHYQMRPLTDLKRPLSVLLSKWKQTHPLH